MSAFTGLRKQLQRSARSWLLLTRDEQKAVLLITALFLIGLSAMAWKRANPAPKPAGDDAPIPRWTQLQGGYVSSSTISGAVVSATLSVSNKQAVLVLGNNSHILRLYRDFDAERKALLQETIEAKGRKYRHTWPVRSLPDGALELDGLRFTRVPNL
jgi:hypothetical protein